MMGGNAFSRDPVGNSSELQRILKIPRRTWTREALEELTDRMTALLKTPNGTMRLRPIQALALYEIGTTGGLLGAMAVGSGKELVCFMAARVLFARHPILVMPAHLVRRSEREMGEYGEHFRMPQGLRILSYQVLSQANRAETLSIVPPDVIIFNEVHRVKNHRAAVTRRVVRHMSRFPNAKVVAVSGTLITKAPTDFAHIARWCVKPCPIPTDYVTTQEWSDALDEKAGAWNQRDPGALLQLCNAEELKEPPLVAARKGFRRRLIETAGVVATEGADDVVDAQGDPVGLEVRALRYEQDPVVEEHFSILRDKWETPSGWAFSLAMGVWRHARELALGFHHNWNPWPEGGIDGPWIVRRKLWKRFVRDTLKGSQTLDSELQVANACREGRLDEQAFKAWTEIAPSYMPATQAVWHCEGALEACQRWARNGPGIIFTDHVFFAQELARRTGLRYFGAGGIDKNGLPIDPPPGPQQDELAASCVIASRQANATGRNIQFWNRSLVTAMPMNASECEQMLGRLHRSGQKAKTVTFDVLLGCAEHLTGWTRSVALAHMTHDLLGAPQKLLLASSDFPSEGEVSGWMGAKWRTTAEKS